MKLTLVREKDTPLRVFWPLSPVQEKAAPSSLTRGEGGAARGEMMSGEGGTARGEVMSGEGGAARGEVMSGE